MATTKAKENSGLGKERRITAPSSVTIPTHTPTKRTPKSSPRGLISSTDPKLSSSSPSPSPSSPSSSSTLSLSVLPEKHIPNYLKSTASSRHDHNFKPVTRSKSGPAPIPEGKPSLNRRRSFDKPPSTAPRLGKPFRSPGPRNRAAHVPVRSSSFGAKPSTTTIVNSTKPGFLDRSSSKISKMGGKPQQPIHSLKSSNSNVKKSLKRESSNAAASASVSASASASASAEIVPKTKNAVEHVDHSPSFVLGVNEEDLKKIECELDPYLPDPMPELDKQLRIDQVEKKAVLDKDEADTETFKVVVANKEVEEIPEAAETEISLTNRERDEVEGEEEKPERIAVEKEEVVGSEEINTNNKNDQEKSETDPVLDGESYKEENDHKAAETTEKEAEATEKAAAAVVAKPRQGGPGRKESPAMYNHVIEETASKLLEKRKNKVRALAGAFQTVIDYESSSK